jgi:glycosyltransferase involved in cell wall biosynthesis
MSVAISPAIAADRGALDARRRFDVGLELLKVRAIEYLTHDSWTFKTAAGIAGYAAAVGLGLSGRPSKQIELLCRLHRSNFFGPTNALAMMQLRRAADGDPVYSPILSDHIRNFPRSAGTANFIDRPQLLIGLPTIVLKSPRGRDKGVLVAHYNHIFPLLARSLDLERVAERYHIVLEPSWRGYAELDILSYARYKFPVFVQSVEPRDSAVLTGLGSQLIPVPTSANSWVDHRVWRPLPVEKEYDVAMVAVWSSYKRHAPFFAALSRLRRSGHRLRVLLLGGNREWTRERILDQARYYGVGDQVHIPDGLPYDEVNATINKAKVHVLWSRTEGVNRAIIECMFAGLPSIVREGFNYGHRYPYVNSETGAFASERTLPSTLLEMVERSGDMRPRDWAMAHISPQRSTQLLAETIGNWSAAHGESWTPDLAVKVTRLNLLKYWDDNDKAAFEPDYEFLRDCIRTP